MKNFKYTVVFVLFVSIVSASFAFTPHRIKPVDTRAEGMGGPYYTDSESFYTLFSNPAALAFAGEKTMWPPFVSIGVGGPLTDVFNFVPKLISGDDMSATLTDQLPSLIGDSGFSVNTRIGGPLTFGAIRKNFGWGFVNTMTVSGVVPTLSKSDIHAGFDLGVVFGYAYPIDFGILGKLSLGVAGRVITQIQAVYIEGATELIDNFDVATIPAYTTFGFGFDLGVQYKVLNLIHVAIVLQDVYTPTWTQTFPGYESIMSDKGSSPKYAKLESTLGIGIGVDIPLEKITNNVISHFGVYMDYSNLWPLFRKSGIYRNPVLELSMGTELILFDKLALRFGFSEMYLSAGLGVYVGNFKMNFSVYGKELGIEPGYSPQLNMGLSIAIQY